MLFVCSFLFTSNGIINMPLVAPCLIKPFQRHLGVAIPVSEFHRSPFKLYGIYFVGRPCRKFFFFGFHY